MYLYTTDYLLTRRMRKKHVYNLLDRNDQRNLCSLEAITQNLSILHREQDKQVYDYVRAAQVIYIPQ